MVNAMELFRLQLIFVLIQLVIGVWTRFAPVKKISNPSKKAFVGCCYYSKRAAGSQEMWDYAQKRYSYWSLFLLLPSGVASYAAAKIFVFAIPYIFHGDAPSMFYLMLSLLVPIGFLMECRMLTERDLKALTQKES